MLSKKDIEKFDKDNELWDSKKLGASAEHAVPVPPEFEKALDEATGLQLLSFRIQKSIIEQLKQLSKLEGIGYQPLMRKVITKYVRENEHRLEQLLTPSQAAENADELFVLAIKLRQQILTLSPLSNERVSAECDYFKALTQANVLFGKAYDRCSDLVLKQHSKLRLSQIQDLIDQDSKEDHNKKYGKAV